VPRLRTRLRRALNVTICVASLALLAASSPSHSQTEDDKRLSPRRLQPADLAVAADEVALDQQFNALQALWPRAASYNEIGLVSEIDRPSGFLFPQWRSLAAGRASANVVSTFTPLLLLSGTETLKVKRTERLHGTEQRRGWLEQSIRGVPG
jgi:hypothetical protein